MEAPLTGCGEGRGGGFQDYGFRPRYGFLDTFWRDVMQTRPGRQWLVCSLIDGELRARDAFALMAVKERLHERSDVTYQYVRAWAPGNDDLHLDDTDVLFLGRPKPFWTKSLSPIANLLERDMVGEFRDKSDGTTSNSVWYGGRRFQRRELEVSPEEHRRCDLDYGLLLFRTIREGNRVRRVIAFAGLSTLGTLGLTLVMTDDARRRDLLAQAEALAPWRDGLRPSESLEICVRINVGGPERLEKFVNEPEFHFRVEAVAVAGAGPTVRPVADAEIELIVGRDGTGRLVHEAGEAQLTAARCRLVRQLLKDPEHATVEALRTHLRLESKARGALHKLVHDTNESVRDQIPGLVRLIRYGKRRPAKYVIGPGKVVE